MAEDREITKAQATARTFFLSLDVSNLFATLYQSVGVHPAPLPERPTH